jgi:uncharacterized damage-inducible protein DinB
MSFDSSISSAYALGHQHILALLSRLSEDELHWRPTAQAHTIAFEAWHLARWADHLQAHLPVMTPTLANLLAPRAEIWQQEGLAQEWGFPPAGALGHDETGMYMSDAAAIDLPLPEKAPLLDYARRAFAAAEEVLAQVPGEQLQEANIENPQESVLDVLLSHIVHDGRHLGMIECLLGIQSGHGTATV